MYYIRGGRFSRSRMVGYGSSSYSSTLNVGVVPVGVYKVLRGEALRERSRWVWLRMKLRERITVGDVRILPHCGKRTRESC
jgi:hypothetical protein